MALTKDQILDGIAELSVIELKDLLDAFEEKFGVTAAAPVAVAAAGGAAAGGAAPAAAEKDEFTVILKEGGEPFEPLCASGAILSCHAFGLASARPAAFLPSRLNRCALQGSRTFKLPPPRNRRKGLAATQQTFRRCSA